VKRIDDDFFGTKEQLFSVVSLDERLVCAKKRNNAVPVLVSPLPWSTERVDRRVDVNTTVDHQDRQSG